MLNFLHTASLQLQTLQHHLYDTCQLFLQQLETRILNTNLLQVDCLITLLGLANLHRSFRDKT
uniref:Uncharacterized protein n=1 Tax=Rheinheimera sp. BAL341 TaxID=1708203 RepID=A0A486XFR5_9GAMM